MTLQLGCHPMRSIITLSIYKYQHFSSLLFFSLLYYFQLLQSLFGGVYTQQILIQILLQYVIIMSSYLCYNYFANSLAPAHRLYSSSMMIHEPWSMMLPWTCSIHGLCRERTHAVYLSAHHRQSSYQSWMSAVSRREIICNVKYLIFHVADDNWEYEEYPGNAELTQPSSNELRRTVKEMLMAGKPWFRN